MDSFLKKYGLEAQRTFSLNVKTIDFQKELRQNVRKGTSLPVLGHTLDTFKHTEHKFAGRLNKDEFRIRRINVNSFGSGYAPRIIGQYKRENSKLKVTLFIDGLGFFWKFNLTIAACAFVIISGLSIISIINSSNQDDFTSDYSFTLLIVPFVIIGFIFLILFKTRNEVKEIITDITTLFNNIENKSNSSHL